MRSSDPPLDSTDASTRESAFLPFSATSEYDCSGCRSDSPFEAANRIRRTGHRIRRSERYRLPLVASEEANVTRRSAGPSRSTRRAYTGPTEAGHSEPHGTSDSRLAEASRTVLPALRRLAANGKRGTRSTRVSIPATEAAASAHGASLKRIHDLRTTKNPILRDPMRIQRRLIAAATRQAHHGSSPKRRTARSGSSGRKFGDGRASTSVPINTLSEDSASNLASSQTLRTHEVFKVTSRFGRRSSRYVATVPGFAFANPKAGRDLGNEILHPRERSEGRTERRTRHGSLLPESSSAHVFEPTGRSQTTSPMGFAAFRRNQHR